MRGLNEKVLDELIYTPQNVFSSQGILASNTGAGPVYGSSCFRMMDSMVQTNALWWVSKPVEPYQPAWGVKVWRPMGTRNPAWRWSRAGIMLTWVLARDLVGVGLTFYKQGVSKKKKSKAVHFAFFDRIITLLFFYKCSTDSFQEREVSRHKERTEENMKHSQFSRLRKDIVCEFFNF